MNISRAFGKFHKQNRLVDEVTIHPDDIDKYNLDYSEYNSKFYKWTAEVRTDKDMRKGCFELISLMVQGLHSNEIREVFS